MKILILFLYAIIMSNAHAENFETYFSSGDYVKALETLNAGGTINEKSFYLAICYSRMQDYDKANFYFQKAIDEKSAKQDIYYEYGQALYAANDLKKSRIQFKSSAQHEFNQAASLYYVGHISQLLDDYDAVVSSYNIIINYYPKEIKLKQVAQFQLAETILANLKDKTALQVDKYVLPLLKEARRVDPTSTVSQEIDRRYHDLLIEYKLDPDLLENGRRVSSRHWDANLSQKIKYDQNVTLTNFENNITQTQKKSFIFESEAYINHLFIFNKKFIIAPEARFTFTKYSNQSDSDVFQNDSSIINLSLKNKYEHQVFSKPASLIFDIDYANTSKDYNKIHKRENYAHSLDFSFGNTFSFFKMGDSTVKYKRKNYTGTNTSISNTTDELSINQTLQLQNQNLIILLINGSRVDNYNNTSMNTDSVLFRVDYLIPEIISKYTLALALAETRTDTKAQTATRGTENTLNPSIDFSRKINNELTLSTNFDYTNNKSKSSDYTYKKEVITMELKYVF